MHLAVSYCDDERGQSFLETTDHPAMTGRYRDGNRGRVQPPKASLTAAVAVAGGGLAEAAYLGYKTGLEQAGRQAGTIQQRATHRSAVHS